MQKRTPDSQGLHYNLPCDAEVSEPMVRRLTGRVANMLKVRGRVLCNPESARLNRIIVANAIIIIQAIV